MNKKVQANESVTKKFVISFGFIEGLWIAAGVNPEGEVINAFISIFKDLGAPVVYIFLMKVLPIIALIVTLCWIYTLGGKLGLVAVALAFLGGVFLLNFTILGLILTLIGLGIGFIAFPS